MSTKETIIDIPDCITKRIKALQTQVGALDKLAKTHNQHLNFTLDGRLVGDIGELIVAIAYDIQLHKEQKPGRDGVFKSGKLKGQQVEIKTRRKSDAMDIRRIPQNLIIIEIIEGDHQAKVIYSGPGAPLKKFWKLKNADLEKQDEWNARKIKSGSRRISLKDFANDIFQNQPIDKPRLFRKKLQNFS